MQMVPGKIALVTGGGSGIGRAICQVLAREGAKVIIADINYDHAKETVSTLEDPSQHIAQEMDVSKKDTVEAAILASVEKHKSPPTLVVNCAGIVKESSFLSSDFKDYTAIMDVNVKGTMLVSQVAVRAMLDHGSTGGSMVNVSSIAYKAGFANLSQYAASKGAVTSFTKSIALELASSGIRVNCVQPGMIETPIFEKSNISKDKILQILEENCPLKRFGRPEEVADVVVFLLSDRASYMTGACVEITGGFNM